MSWIVPNWNAPKNVKAISTTREGGFSAPPFDGLNLGRHVGDDNQQVELNRRWLEQQAKIPSAPAWLNQIHSTDVAELPLPANTVVSADASVSSQAGSVCTVMTADCVPVLFCNRQGTQVAAAHAGWRGLLNGVLENTLAKMDGEVMAWIGPAISQSRFEVGPEVRQQFVDTNASLQGFFLESANPGKWMADLEAIVAHRLTNAGVTDVSCSGLCTFDDERFFSYRQNSTTGRQASLIWFEE